LFWFSIFEIRNKAAATADFDFTKGCMNDALKSYLDTLIDPLDNYLRTPNMRRLVNRYFYKRIIADTYLSQIFFVNAVFDIVYVKQSERPDLDNISLLLDTSRMYLGAIELTQRHVLLNCRSIMQFICRQFRAGDARTKINNLTTKVVDTLCDQILNSSDVQTN
jgi:hypothetical protein